MAAPVAVVRGTPAGRKFEDGYQSKVTLNSRPTLEIWEKTIKPPGMDGGPAVDQTTMHNTVWKTFSPRSLVTLTETTIKAAWDPILYSIRASVINTKNETITVLFPDGTTLAFFGYIMKIEPAEFSEGTQPDLAVTIVATNKDSSGAEQAPVLVNVAGT